MEDLANGESQSSLVVLAHHPELEVQGTNERPLAWLGQSTSLCTLPGDRVFAGAVGNYFLLVELEGDLHQATNGNQ